MSRRGYPLDYRKSKNPYIYNTNPNISIPKFFKNKKAIYEIATDVSLIDVVGMIDL